jgi:chorismate synthase
MIDLIKRVKADGDSIGGIVTCTVKGCPAGLGEPVFDKLSARLASAMMSINAAKGFEIGMGFDGAKHRGSEMIDNWVADADDARGMHAATNHSGGIQAGISNGEDIVMRVAFKPVATLLRDVDTVDDKGRPAVLKAKGRHDPCVVPRAIPVVEAMAAMTVLDAYLLNKTVHL